MESAFAASSYSDRVVPLESIAVLGQLERIAPNGVYFSNEGDRRGRVQIAGYDHLMTTVYIDGAPYLVDMRVRVEDERAGGGNRLYHFTPEAIEVTKKNDGTTSTAGRHATSVHSTDVAPSSAPIIADSSAGGNTQSAQSGPESSVGAAQAGFTGDEAGESGFHAPSAIQDADLTSAFGENGAQAYRLGWRGDMDEADYYRAFAHAYNAGAAGRSLDSLKDRTLTDAQRGAAFESGRSDADAAARKAGFTTVYGKDSGLVWDDYTKSMDQKVAGQVNEVAKRLGVKVQFADRVAGGAANGKIENGVITIARDAKNPVRAVFGHEITHRIQELAPEEYRAFREAAIAETEYLDQKVEGTRALYAKGDQELSNLEAMDEIAADYAGSLVEDGALLDRFIQSNQGKRTLLEKLRDVFRSLADRLTGKYKSQARQAERRLEQALKAAESRAEAMQGQKNTAQEGGEAKHSFKGYDEKTGRGIYESNFPLGTLRKAKAERILSLVQNVWSKMPIDLVIEEDGKKRNIQAQFDPTYDPSGNTPSDVTKLMGGNRHGTASERRVTLDLADDYYQIASEATYNYS